MRAERSKIKNKKIIKKINEIGSLKKQNGDSHTSQSSLRVWTLSLWSLIPQLIVNCIYCYFSLVHIINSGKEFWNIFGNFKWRKINLNMVKGLTLCFQEGRGCVWSVTSVRLCLLSYALTIHVCKEGRRERGGRRKEKICWKWVAALGMAISPIKIK